MHHAHLAKYLSDPPQNFGYCTADEFKVITNDEEKTAEQINIDIEPIDRPKIPGCFNVIFNIYVKNPNVKDCRTKIEAIREHLEGKMSFHPTLNSDCFKYTKILTEPYFWGKTNQENFIYTMKIKTFITTN